VSQLIIHEWQRLGTAGRSRTFVVVECRLRSANECEVLRATCGADLFRLNLYYGEAKSSKIKKAEARSAGYWPGSDGRFARRH
jgi:hypothetical protein